MEEKTKNCFKKNKVVLTIILATVFAFVLVGFFIIDLGINSKFFIKKDFNQAFLYRTTGDCDAFTYYLNSDIESWKERCQKEKNHDKEPIRDFSIQKVSHNFGNDRAFLQVELKRNNYSF
ncbi:MAG: hypothetical protein ABIJ84_03655 [bacterium]